MNENSILVIDIMLSDLYLGTPRKIWDNVTNTIIPMRIMLKYIRKHGLIIRHFHSLVYRYERQKNYQYTDRGARFYLLKT